MNAAVQKASRACAAKTSHGAAVPLILRLPEAKRAVIVGMSAMASGRAIADAVGVSRPTIGKWLREGGWVLGAHENFDSVPREPVEQFEMARLAAHCRAERAKVFMMLIEHAVTEARDCPALMQWLLPKLYPAEFAAPSKRAQLTIEGTSQAAARLVRAKFASHVDTDGVAVVNL